MATAADLRRRYAIVSGETGGGHTSAANALVWGLGRVDPLSETLVMPRALEQAHPLSAALSGVYNHLLRHRPSAVRHDYRLIQRIRPNEWRLFCTLAGRRVRAHLTPYRPDLIVCVHPMLPHLMGQRLRDLGWLARVPLVVVVTDPCHGFWRGRAGPDVSLFVVATDGARRQLLEYGVPDWKIRIRGMPVHPKFQGRGAAGRLAARAALGLHPDRFTVLVNAGSVGGGNMPRILDALVTGGEALRETQIICLAGRNDALRAWMHARVARAAFRSVVLPHTSDMDQLMNASDVTISRPGGLTTFEALTSGLPIVADATTAPMPQEAGTLELICSEGAAVPLRQFRDAVPTIERLRRQPAALGAMRTAAVRLARPGATLRIAEELRQIADERAVPEADAVPRRIRPDARTNGPQETAPRSNASVRMRS